MNAYILLKISGDRLPEENVKYAPVLQYIKRKDFLIHVFRYAINKFKQMYL